MVARRNKTYATGEASNFMTRKHAMRKLQLNLKDFRRLCILKGIHPREPRNRKRAQKGDMTKVQTLFHEKDIRFLLHEPIVWKFRDFKVFVRKLKKATAKGNFDAVARLKDNTPKYNLDHIVKERYPTFIDAIRDLEDCLCLCALYATFPKNARLPVEMITLCRRLMIEFMHYVIEAKALRKVFVSIKGYYYQVEIMGQTITWIVPHSFAYAKPENVDLKLMAIFVEFYTTMLGFVNYRLYHKLNLQYPPSLAGYGQTMSHADDQDALGEELSDRITALNRSLVRTVTHTEEEDTPMDDIPMAEDDGMMEEIKRKAEQLKHLTHLFAGMKVFLGREVPREPLVFMIRALGGEVSWDATAAPGSTFGESEPSVTHQISDRPKESLQMSYLQRVYVQPQWIFDSINQGQLLPVQTYFVGEVLPPHLSPFIADRRVGDYIPPEEKELLGLAEPAKAKKAEEQEKEEDDSEDEEEDDEEEEEGDEEESEEEGAPSKMKVELGKPEVVDKEKAKKMMEDEEFKLRTMMIKKKHKGLYRSMMKSRKRRVHETKQLEWKRKEFENKQNQAGHKSAEPKGPKAVGGKAKKAQK
ncbi:hypothetical protein TCAL_00552 [Tigriopus californicus]|uniref:Pescadillo homolog n=1 Tax=Tigriopus californicus TaxID=6832 RepID=A0A553PAM9_TIGCA|nr:pescadillo homolog [Tigriopus californicus]TRY74743.1 hypothetical protein TCAL_00552 [Tigriopus californicus]